MLQGQNRHVNSAQIREYLDRWNLIPDASYHYSQRRTSAGASGGYARNAENRRAAKEEFVPFSCRGRAGGGGVDEDRKYPGDEPPGLIYCCATSVRYIRRCRY